MTNGTVRPRALAVLTFVTNSNLVGCSTGRSALSAGVEIRRLCVVDLYCACVTLFARLSIACATAMDRPERTAHHRRCPWFSDRGRDPRTKDSVGGVQSVRDDPLQ